MEDNYEQGSSEAEQLQRESQRSSRQPGTFASRPAACGAKGGEARAHCDLERKHPPPLEVWMCGKTTSLGKN